MATPVELPEHECPAGYRRVVVHSRLAMAWALIRESFAHPNTGTCIHVEPRKEAQLAG